MFDHLGLSVGDFARSLKFYSAALQPLGYRVSFHEGESAGIGKDGTPQLWLGRGAKPSHSTHVALVAPTRAAVDHFYSAALEAGGTDNGAPGPRPQYDEGYYAAFVRDPDGNNVEAVFHAKKHGQK